MYRCGIYTRVSTEEQAENPEGSIKNQELRLREFVKLKSLVAPFGEVTAVFSDPGVSAKDMNRPGFQKLLRAIERKEISLILVTELSRFTRSMKDFSLLQDFMRKHGCEFLSLRENFDSSSATGSLVMSIMATLAEFERKQTAERISNSFHERAKRGLYNGGSVPLGYRIDETRPGNLAIVPEEAVLIRLVFQTFLKEELLAKTAKRLNRDGVLFPRSVRGSGGVRGRIWRANMLHPLLKHKGYIGVRVFKDKKGNELETPAAWEPIVEVAEFDRAQNMLAKNRSQKRTHGARRYPYILSGSLFCRTCGHRMAGKSAHGRNGKIAYYDHSYALKQQGNVEEKIKICDGHHRIQATLIEPLVWKDVKEFLTDEALARDLLTKAKAASPLDTGKDRQEKLKAALVKAEAQVEALAERVGVLPKGLDPKALYEQLDRIQGSRDQLRLDVEQAANETESTDEYLSLESLQAFTEGLRKQLDQGDDNPEIQAAIIRKIVFKIEVLAEGYEIFYHAGMNHYQAELGISPGSAFLHLPDSENEKRPASSPQRGGSRPHFIFPRKSVAGSTFILNGGRCRGRTYDIHLVSKQSADFITL
jgi:site-specific DNA recombinase